MRHTNRDAMIRRLFFILLLLIICFFLTTALVPGLLAPYSPYEQNPTAALQPPSAKYWLGTDQFGRDILSRVIFGGRVAIFVGLGSVLLAMVLGVPLGLIAGYTGGTLDAMIMRLQDALLSFPPVILALLIIASFGASALVVVLTIALVYIPRFARLVRASVLQLKGREFVIASHACGTPVPRILLRIILPNAIAPDHRASDIGHRRGHPHRVRAQLFGSGYPTPHGILGQHAPTCPELYLPGTLVRPGARQFHLPIGTIDQSSR